MADLSPRSPDKPALKIGAIFPHFEFPPDPVAIRDYAQAAEGLGFSHIGADDHVIGPNPNRPGGWTGWVTHQLPFYEPFVLFSYLAGLTQRIEFSTCVLLLPQRQTVLAAKQAAVLDVLCGGRLRLGFGNGWNEIEYRSLNADFHNRGKRLDEQVCLLRRLWTETTVDYQGKYHDIPNAGLNPLPVQRPIPIWFGGQSPAMIRRVARLGDGWMPLYGTPAEAAEDLARLDQELAQIGRSRAELGFEARIPYGNGDPQEWRKLVMGWKQAGVTHLSLLTTRSGLKNPAEHIEALRRFAAEIF